MERDGGWRREEGAGSRVGEKFTCHRRRDGINRRCDRCKLYDQRKLWPFASRNFSQHKHVRARVDPYVRGDTSSFPSAAFKRESYGSSTFRGKISASAKVRGSRLSRRPFTGNNGTSRGWDRVNVCLQTATRSWYTK